MGDTVVFMPSSLGLTVSLAADVRQFVVEVRYGRYERHIDEATGKPYWQRIPITFVSKPFPMQDGLIAKTSTNDEH